MGAGAAEGAVEADVGSRDKGVGDEAGSEICTQGIIRWVLAVLVKLFSGVTAVALLGVDVAGEACGATCAEGVQERRKRWGGAVVVEVRVRQLEGSQHCKVDWKEVCEGLQSGSVEGGPVGGELDYHGRF
jgi:hypothetical protein